MISNNLRRFKEYAEYIKLRIYFYITVIYHANNILYLLFEKKGKATIYYYIISKFDIQTEHTFFL